MSDINLEIDGKAVVINEGATILEAATSAGIKIPTLCYHPALKSYGGCRLCIVEIQERGKSSVVTSCNYPVSSGLVVKSDSENIINDRKILIELLMARCPEADAIQHLAKDYKIEKSRFKSAKPEELCLLCGLCARICSEVVGASALDFVNRGISREIGVMPEITAEACIGCGACAMVCPTGLISMEDLFGRKVIHSEAMLGPNKAISIPIMQAVPNAPTIDDKSCIHFKTGACQLCFKSCERNAINYEMEEEIVEVEVGNIIMTTGYKLFDPAPMFKYGYGRLPNVITSFEFEKMVMASGPTGGKILLQNGHEPKQIGIIHCVGSRDINYHEYCSRVCCMYSMKFAHLVREHLPRTEVYEFYIDIRSPGKGFEEFYNRVLKEGTVFYRGRPGEVTDVAETPEEKGKLIVKFENTLVGKQLRLPVEMVILSCGLEAQSDVSEVARTFNISNDASGFFIERHPKLDPVATMTDGVFVAGCCQGPKDIPDTVAQAAAAAARVLALISKGKVETVATIAEINEEQCSGCRVCNELCPYSAISFLEKEKVSRINDALCKGCGACVAACPSGAITHKHFTDEQIMAEIEGILV
jgi:heterodisulfide reductase subunit A